MLKFLQLLQMRMQKYFLQLFHLKKRRNKARVQSPLLLQILQNNYLLLKLSKLLSVNLAQVQSLIFLMIYLSLLYLLIQSLFLKLRKLLPRLVNLKNPLKKLLQNLELHLRYPLLRIQLNLFKLLRKILLLHLQILFSLEKSPH